MDDVEAAKLHSKFIQVLSNRRSTQGEQGDLPVLILSMKESRMSKRPAIMFLHRTNKCKEWVRSLLEVYASHGYIAVAIDSSHHVNGSVEEMDDVKAAKLHSKLIQVLSSRRFSQGKLID
ncbi:hypothetical protein L1987_85828 [Smallanthus sonchifolius]|uniref:Uncharacterized protein n=1 Tax=Smallanthus sonchifolius TaxID=185202 RepID=A0ACB8XXN2_9ASTR|nr:hypothetical protein L1987_85828 [Smallanthus sonchifolius]